MQFEFDPERLIEEVKQRPGIWNYEDVNYRSMVSRHQLWYEVVQELIQPNVSISKSEMRELVFQLQKKWKSIKDAFQKYTQHPNRTRRPYLYHRHLQFLLKNTEHDGAATSESDDDQKKTKKVKNKTNNSDWVSKKRMIVVKDEDNSFDNDEYPMQDASTFSNDDDDLPLAKKPRNSATQSGPESFAFASVSNIDTKPSEGEDPDKMFLLSLLPHLKSIPESSRLSIKMELLRVLHNAN